MEDIARFCHCSSQLPRAQPTMVPLPMVEAARPLLLVIAVTLMHSAILAMRMWGPTPHAPLEHGAQTQLLLAAQVYHHQGNGGRGNGSYGTAVVRVRRRKLLSGLLATPHR